MTIKSMTGFARADGTLGPMAWHWELRSVNGRGLDIRLRLPPGFDALEPRIREAVGKRISRGSLTINLNVKRTHGQTEIRLNEAALRQVLTAVERIRATAQVAAPGAEALLNVRGVLELVEPEETEVEAAARAEAMLAGLDRALDGMIDARAAEGGRLGAIVAQQLDQIQRLAALVERLPARAPAAVRQRLKEQVAKLMEPGVMLDETRLYQEAALLEARSDVEEELKRLAAHVDAARALLDAKEPAGRRLDFLAQEFNRESNTLCSKSNAAAVSAIGLELKSVVDQFREQVQNLE